MNRDKNKSAIKKVQKHFNVDLCEKYPDKFIRYNGICWPKEEAERQQEFWKKAEEMNNK